MTQETHTPQTGPSEFTEHDWDGYAGAERWPNGDAPLIHEINGFLLVADRNGVEVFPPDEQDTWLDMNYPFPTQKAARAFLAGLPEDFLPEDYGFVRVQ